MATKKMLENNLSKIDKNKNKKRILDILARINNSYEAV